MAAQLITALLPVVLFALAAVFKAIADTLMFHFDTSVFRYKDPEWWNPMVSCDYVKFLPLTRYRPDGWHLANSASIVLCAAALALHSTYGLGIYWFFEVAILGAVFIGSFNLFYNKVLRRL